MDIIHILNKCLAEPFLSLIAPNRCLVCGELCENDELLHGCMCRKCYNNLPLFVNFDEMTTRLIGTTGKENQAINSAFGLIDRRVNRDYMNLIYNLKYYNFRRVGYLLGLELAKYMKQCGVVDYDVVIPVPIHSAKRRERGYNQSNLIAKAVAEELGIDYDFKVVQRVVYTNTQTKLSHDNRAKNVSGIFRVVNPEVIKNKRVLVVDDVFTTGTTINSMALEIRKHGSKSVSAATLVVA